MNNSLRVRSVKEKYFSDTQDYCKIETWGDVDFSDDQGSSQTFQAIIKLKNGPERIMKMAGDKIFVKAYPENLYTERMGYQDNSLQREVVILRYLSYFLKYRVTTCVQKYYADFVRRQKRGDLWDRQAVEKIFKNGQSLYKIDQKEYESRREMRFVLSEYVEGETLTTWVLNGPKLEDCKSILFQLLYTCWQFYLGGIRHNDLHSDNVIIEKSNGQPLYFVFGDRVIKVAGNYIARIIDYDRAGFYSDTPLENDTWNNLCGDYGICASGLNRNADPLKVLTGIYQLSRNVSSIRDYMSKLTKRISSEPEEIFDNPDSKYMTRIYGVACQIPKGDGECDNWELPEHLLMFFPQMVADNVFEVEIFDISKLESKEKVYWSLDVRENLSSFLENERPTF